MPPPLPEVGAGGGGNRAFGPTATWNMKRPFQAADSGNCTWKAIWYVQLSTGLVCLLMCPLTMQRSGRPVVGVLAAVSVAESITVLGTGKPAADNVARLAQDATGVTGVPIDVFVVEKSAH